MTARKKRGVGFIVSAVIFGLVGIFRLTADVDPGWIGTAFQIAQLVAGVLGFTLVFPDRKE